MEHIIKLLVILVFSMKLFVQSAPIHNGFSVKFNPILTKEDLAPKTFGALFAKISQDSQPKQDLRTEILSKAFFPDSAELGNGCSNQIAKLAVPMDKGDGINGSKPWNNRNPMNLPIIRQPYDSYDILVATAPPNIKLGPDGKDLVVYIVFPEDRLNPTNPLNIPKVYFVNSEMEVAKKDTVDPVFIMDSNRTVTGLKSNGLSKFVRFKGKLINRSNIEYGGTLANNTRNF